MTTDEQIIEQAVEAAARERYAQAVVEHGRPAEPWDGHYSTATKAILVAYFASLAEQGIVLVEQPTKPCEKCGGKGYELCDDCECHPGCRDARCPACNGSGTVPVVLVDVQELR